jgi:hypothetical protein
MKKRTTVGALVASFALLGVPVGSAQDANSTQYGNPASVVAKEKPKQAGTPAGGVSPAGTGTLPFTGAELGLTLAFGAAAVAGGFGLRRLGRRSLDR